jgi:hypothetical protein
VAVSHAHTIYARNNLIILKMQCPISEVMFFIIVILPVVLYGCETWSLTLGEEHRLRVFENRVLRIFGPKGRKTYRGENYIIMSFMTCILRRILLG